MKRFAATISAKRALLHIDRYFIMILKRSATRNYMFYAKLIIGICLVMMSGILPIKSFAQTDGFPPDDWMGGAEVDWLVDVPNWDTLNVRSLPNHKSKKIGALKPGTIVGIDDRADNGWVYIFSGSIGGWVNSAYLCEANFSGCKNLKAPTKSTKPKPIIQTPQAAPQITVPSPTTRNTSYPKDLNLVDDSILKDVNAWAEINGNTSKWLQYDHLYLHEIPTTMNSPQMTVLSLSYSRSEMSMLVQSLYGFVDLAAKAIQEHPNWTSEDILIEVNSNQLSQLELKQENFIRYLTKNRLTINLLREREKALDKKLADCLRHINEMRPTLRPTLPRKKCVVYIIADK